MTAFWAEDRPRLANGRPCWLSAKDIALPRLLLQPPHPVTPGCWRAEVMIPRSSNLSSLQVADIPEDELQTFLSDWESDPEAALENWFDTQAQPYIQIITQPPTRVARKNVAKERGSLDDLRSMFEKK